MTAFRARPPGASPGASILLVEDDDAMRELCTLVLNRAGYEIVSAADGDEAGRLLARRGFDLLMTDNSMPGLCGLDLVDWVRRSGNQIPVIVASGSAGEDDVAAAKWTGYVRALPKPFLMTELLGAVADALRHGLGPGPEN